MKEYYVSPYLTSQNDVVVVRTDLACAIGAYETMLLNQIQYWINRHMDEDHFKDGKYWTYQTYEGWHEQLPFLSLRTIKNLVKSLKNKGIIETGQFNKKNWDRTIWYTINYDKLDEIMRKSRECKSCTVDSENPAQSVVQTMHDQECKPCTTNTKDYTENTTKTTTETSKKVLSISKENAPRITNRTEYMDFVRKVLEDSDEFNSCIDELCNGIEYFLVQYRMCKGKEHIRLKGITIVQIARALEPYKDDLREMIDKYFDTDFRLDYCGLSHFASESILELKGYEVGALGSVPVRNFV